MSLHRSTPALSSSQFANWPGASWWAGLALAGAIAGAGLWLANLESMKNMGFSALTFAIVLGMALGNSVFPRIAPHTSTGVDFCKARLLRLGIILFGFRLTFQEAASVGAAGIVLDAVIILSVYGLAMGVGTRILKMDRQTCMLVGAGSAICGAAAVMAMEPIARAQAHKVSVAVATVVVFGTISMFLYPVLYPYLGMSEHAFGIFIGSTVHEVAQVVAAGDAVGPVAASTAVVEKMLRVMMLAPFLMLVSWWVYRRARKNTAGSATKPAAPALPWFAVWFVVAVGLNSTGLVSPQLAHMLVQFSTVLLAMAMAALGLRTHVSAIRQAGAAPLALAGVLFLFLLFGGYGLNLFVSQLF
ncbi:MAG: YeiH family putative sulfate export transporter [Alcaligenaceae bacterium]|nr:YeiH family putative sulfate export transporter [Alcaligenaceae bacterium]